ncbi:MAG: hypothetical protein MUO57_19510, partial [Anaerolineales bacterium]|nr:hypothetical protein [Anaerolineales bacterium]
LQGSTCLTPAAADRAVAHEEWGPKSRVVGLKIFEICQPRPAAELFRWAVHRISTKIDSAKSSQ